MNPPAETRGFRFFLDNLRLYSRLLTYLRRHWVVFAVGLFFIIVYSATTPGVTILMKPLLDGTFVDKNPTLILWMPILLIVLYFVRGLSNYFNALCMSWLSEQIVYELREEMVDRIVALPTRFYDHFPSGQLAARITGDVTALTSAATNVFVVVVREVLTIIGLTIWIVILDWVLSITLLIATPMICALIYFIAIKLRSVNRRSMELSALFLHRVNQVTANNRAVKLYRAENHERSNLFEFANRVRQLNFKARVASAIGVPIAEMIGALITAGAVYFTLTREITDPLTVGGFVSFMTAMALIFSSVKKLININDTLQRGLVASERVFFILDQEIEAETLEEPTKSFDRVTEVEVEDVSFTYPKSNRYALQNVSLNIRANVVVALVGASGSGKSTLTALIPRLYEQQQGKIKINGTDIREFSLSELRRMISFVSQETGLFDDTVRANIAYGDIDNATDESIRAAAQAAYATEFIDQLPNGFNTEIGERGVRLSGGQRQRIAIAQAFLKNSPIVILDEATSALDSTSERHVRSAITALRKDRALLIISHRLSSLTNVDKIVVIQAGQIVEEGTHETLMEQKGYYYALYTAGDS